MTFFLNDVTGQDTHSHIHKNTVHVSSCRLTLNRNEENNKNHRRPFKEHEDIQTQRAGLTTDMSVVKLLILQYLQCLYSVSTVQTHQHVKRLLTDTQIICKLVVHKARLWWDSNPQPLNHSSCA